MAKYPIELSQPPNWPPEMVCHECRFKGWQWLGCTKQFFNVVTKGKTWKRCHGCGAGIVYFSSESLPFFVFRK